MSVIDIVNGALDALGEEPIASLDDKGVTAGRMKRRYAHVRDQLIAMHLWNFALRRAEIGADTATPAWGFSRQYTLPADCLRMVGLQTSPLVDVLPDQWMVENGKLLCDIAPPLAIHYIARVDDADAYPALFRRALELYLAYDLCEAFTQSTSRAQALEQGFRRVLAEAKSSDAREGRPGSILGKSSWLAARMVTGPEGRWTR